MMRNILQSPWWLVTLMIPDFHTVLRPSGIRSWPTNKSALGAIIPAIKSECSWSLDISLDIPDLFRSSNWNIKVELLEKWEMWLFTEVKGVELVTLKPNESRLPWEFERIFPVWSWLLSPWYLLVRFLPYCCCRLLALLWESYFLMPL